MLLVSLHGQRGGQINGGRGLSSSALIIDHGQDHDARLSVMPSFLPFLDAPIEIPPTSEYWCAHGLYTGSNVSLSIEKQDT
jgi:hypothetical protein